MPTTTTANITTAILAVVVGLACREASGPPFFNVVYTLSPRHQLLEGRGSLQRPFNDRRAAFERYKHTVHLFEQIRHLILTLTLPEP